MAGENKKTDTQFKIIIFAILIIVLMFFVYAKFIKTKLVVNDEIMQSVERVGFSTRTRDSEISTNKKTEITIDNEGKVFETNFSINSIPVINLNNNNWDRMKSKFTGFQLDEKGNAVFEEGYTLYCNGTYVNYIIFNNSYEKDVIEHIKVGTNLKTIEETLGTPTFKRENCLGYKTIQNYVFFYEDEIVVYPNIKLSNKKLETLFKNYFEKIYFKGRTYFLVDIRNNYKDFSIEEDLETDTIILTSTTRQVIAKLDSLDNIEVELYDGYQVSEDFTKDFIEEKIYLTNEDDLVDIVESERKK